MKNTHSWLNPMGNARSWQAAKSRASVALLLGIAEEAEFGTLLAVLPVKEAPAVKLLASEARSMRLPVNTTVEASQETLDTAAKM